jgi:hypothetical protein
MARTGLKLISVMGQQEMVNGGKPCGPQINDLTVLGQCLSSELSPQGAMQLSDLDGFLSGVPPKTL